MIEKVRIIERYLPLKELNLDSTVEVSFKGLPRDIREEYIKTFGVKPMVIGPRLRNIHTWFARRPCSPARVLTLTSVLPSTIKIDTVLTALGFKNTRQTAKKYGASLLLYTPPNRHLVSKLTNETLHKKPENIVVLDPMAGGGSIPLESLRLGFKTIAIDYNPVAYLILKATLEFPAKYADAGLFEETLKAAKEFISRAHNELGKYYGEDAENYIFARGVRCPFCNGLIPVQGIEPVITKAPRFKRRFLKISYEKSEGKRLSHEVSAALKMENYNDALNLSVKACEKGHIASCWLAGNMYSLGKGVVMDKELGFKYIKKACNSGLTVACNDVCNYYRDNEEYINSAQCYKKVCDEGFASACSSLGNQYLNDQGVDLIRLYYMIQRNPTKITQYQEGDFYAKRRNGETIP